jgi:hypothetical protein
MSRNLAVTTNALIGLMIYAILICRSFPLALNLKYSSYSWDIREND